MPIKRKRLAGGKWVSWKQDDRESSAEDIAKASPDEVWTSGDGRKLLPKDMDLRHIANVMKLLERRQYDTAKAAGLTEEEAKSLTANTSPIYKALARELGRRIRGETKEPDAPRPKRRFNFT